MPINLPLPIESYYNLENSDGSTLAECFAADAIVHDEAQIHRGLSAIVAWHAAAKMKYNHTSEPLEIAERDGKTVVKTRLTGNFPGSPVTVNFSFVLENGMITELEIG